MSGKRFYLVSRDLHLYFGLFLSPFVLVFAISTLFLVHSWFPGSGGQLLHGYALKSKRRGGLAALALGIAGCGWLVFGLRWAYS